VNGFFSVIGSVLTTILSMSYGFSTVQYLGLVIYAIAALAFTRIAAVARRTAPPVADVSLAGGHDLQAVGATPT
jgi:hypothetical protein